MDKYIKEVGGAGDWGTDKATTKFKDDTPGQQTKRKRNMKSFRSVLEKVAVKEAMEMWTVTVQKPMNKLKKGDKQTVKARSAFEAVNKAMKLWKDPSLKAAPANAFKITKEDVAAPGEIEEAKDWYSFNTKKLATDFAKATKNKNADDGDLDKWLDGVAKKNGIRSRKMDQDIANDIVFDLAKMGFKKIDAYDLNTFEVDESIEESDLAEFGSRNMSAAQKANLRRSIKNKQKEEVDLDEVIERHIEEGFSQREIKMAIGIASDKRYAGVNMTGATKAIEKLKKGLSSQPQVMAVLKRQNEEVVAETPERMKSFSHYNKV